MLDLQRLASFLAVVNAGSFVAGAKSSGLSKAAVSRHVAELESELGVRLLHRTTRRLSLSDEGQRFHARALELLEAADTLEAETRSSSGDVSGVLRINAPLTFGNLHLAPLWPGFLRQHPKVTLDITLNDRVVDLVEEGYDLAVRISRMPGSQLVSRQLATTRVVLCASPAYLRNHGTPAHPRELGGHRVISYVHWAGGDEWHFTGSEGEIRVRVQPHMRTNSGDTCRVAALHGQGVILQPDFIVADDLRRGDLVELMPAYQSIDLGIHAVYASRTHLPLKTRRLIDFLVDALAEPGWQASIRTHANGNDR